ncbi:MAG: ABC transporter permease subunit [Candidatus Limnocylindria bacterium]
MTEETIVTAPRPPWRRLGFGRTVTGIAAISTRELRGRMRGRRTFVLLTLYLLALGGYAALMEIQAEREYSTSFGGSAAFASAAIGQSIFTGLLMLMTLQVVFLAPSATAGSISLEREKQTLEMLLATPISSLAIVVGKLLSALAWLFLLILASVPLMSIVFLFGGIGPETVVAGYLVLIAAALGLGSFGLALSCLVRRTTAATAVSVTVGIAMIVMFWTVLQGFDGRIQTGDGGEGIRTPAVVAYLNPFVAQADVLCSAESSFGGRWCSTVDQFVPNRGGVIFIDGDGKDVGPPPVEVPTLEEGVLEGRQPRIAPGEPSDVVPEDVLIQRDPVWMRSVIAWLGVSVLSLFIAIQAVSPTRRWRPRLGRTTRSIDA